jgi:phosphoenolpyruvate carboxylase
MFELKLLEDLKIFKEDLVKCKGTTLTIPAEAELQHALECLDVVIIELKMRNNI